MRSFGFKVDIPHTDNTYSIVLFEECMCTFVEKYTRNHTGGIESYIFKIKICQIMYDEIRDRAIISLERRKKKIRAMQIVGAILGSLVLFLYCMRYLMHEGDRPYMFIPIGILVLVYFIIHTAVLGLPFGGPDYITEEDIENEVVKIYRRYKSSDLHDVNEAEELELKQMETLLNDDEEYV